MGHISPSDQLDSRLQTLLFNDFESHSVRCFSVAGCAYTNATGRLTSMVNLTAFEQRVFMQPHFHFKID